MNKKYTITVSALGYETTATHISAPDLRSAKRFIGKAKKAWASVNDVDYSTTGLASISISAE